MSMRRHFSRSFFTLGAGLLLVAGCKTTGPDRTAGVVQSLQETREGVVNGQKQVDAVTTALDQLVRQPQGDLRPAFDKFSAELGKTQALAESVRARAEALREREEDHFKKWQEEMAGISNPQIRALSEERRRLVKEKIDTLAANFKGARESFQPFMKGLQDIQKVLANDLTAGGVASIGPIAKEAIVEKAKVQDRLAIVVSQLDEIARALSATAPAAAPAPASGPAQSP